MVSEVIIVFDSNQNASPFSAPTQAIVIEMKLILHWVFTTIWSIWNMTYDMWAMWFRPSYFVVHVVLHNRYNNLNVMCLFISSHFPHTFLPYQPIVLLLLDITPMLPVLEGVVMELQDCALPLLKGNSSEMWKKKYLFKQPQCFLFWKDVMFFYVSAKKRE